MRGVGVMIVCTCAVALQKARFKVDVASTAEQAVDMFKTSGPYKIVLMDIQLPKMNGMEATNIIRDFEKAGGSGGSATAAAAAPLDTPTGKSLIFGLTGAVEVCTCDPFVLFAGY